MSSRARIRPWFRRSRAPVDVAVALAREREARRSNEETRREYEQLRRELEEQQAIEAPPAPSTCCVCHQIIRSDEPVSYVVQTVAGWERTEMMGSIHVTTGMRGVDVRDAHIACALQHEEARRTGKLAVLGDLRIRREQGRRR